MASTELAPRSNGAAAALIEQIVAGGDLDRLTTEQRATYVLRLCESLGLNPLSKPFQYIKLQQRLTLYATKDATDQLRAKRGVSIAIVGRERIDDVYVVTARATLPNGRSDEEIGAVPVKGLSGEALANALMKAQTKAKRRVTLSICGLGMLDETELETIPAASIGRLPDELGAEVAVDPETGEIVGAAPAEPADDDAARREREAAVDAYGAAWDAAAAAGVAGRYPRQVPASVALDEIRKGTATLRRRAAADGAPAPDR